MRILFFGKLGDLVGREVRLDLPPEGCSVAELRRLLAGKYPDAVAELSAPSLRAFVDDSLAGEDHRIRPGDRVEFLPPLSGG